MKVIFEKQAKKKFLSFDKSVQIQILKFIKKLENSSDPKDYGRALVGNLKDYWRYRVGDYRLICKILKDELIVLVVDINHRSKIYKYFK